MFGRRRRANPFVIILLMIAAAAAYLNTSSDIQPERGSFKGRCVAVSDGDTIRVLKGTEEVKVRLHGIDCPEKNQAYGNKAKVYTSALVFGRTVAVDIRGKDRYGRVLGWVSLEDGRVLNV